jgi:hypothetical protein
MLDDLRQQASELFDQEEPPGPPPAPRPPSRLFGMTPFQTFLVAVMLLVITCLLSASCLVVTGRVVPPFLY